MKNKRYIQFLTISYERTKDNFWFTNPKWTHIKEWAKWTWSSLWSTPVTSIYHLSQNPILPFAVWRHQHFQEFSQSFPRIFPEFSQNFRGNLMENQLTLIGTGTFRVEPSPPLTTGSGEGYMRSRNIYVSCITFSWKIVSVSEEMNFRYKIWQSWFAFGWFFQSIYIDRYNMNIFLIWCTIVLQQNCTKINIKFTLHCITLALQLTSDVTFLDKSCHMSSFTLWDFNHTKYSDYNHQYVSQVHLQRAHPEKQVAEGFSAFWSDV